MSLRLFPFLCGLAGLFLFWRVAARVLDGIAVPIAIALFAISPPLLRYSAELKQYGGDVVVILGLTLVTLDLCERAPSLRRCCIAGAAGAVAVLFSQAAVLVLAGLGAALTIRWITNRNNEVAARTAVFVTVPIWACAALGGLILAQHHTLPQTIAFMHVFWRSRAGFLPLPVTPVGTLLWTRDRFVQFFGLLSGYPLPLLYAVLALAGFLVVRRRRDVAPILLGPLAVTFAAAVAQQYPFRARVVLFLLPTMLLTAAASIGWIVERIARVSRPAAGALALAAMLPPLLAIRTIPPPYAVEQFKPVLAYVQAHRKPGDKIYVFSNSFEAVARYGPQFGMVPSSYVNGSCDSASNTPLLVDVDQFRGEPRVWVIASSVPDWAPARRAMNNYLGTIGVRRDSISLPSLAPLSPVSAELLRLERHDAPSPGESTGLSDQDRQHAPILFRLGAPDGPSVSGASALASGISRTRNAHAVRARRRRKSQRASVPFWPSADRRSARGARRRAPREMRPTHAPVEAREAERPARGS